MRTTREVVQAFFDAFNRHDVGALVALYAEDAVNHQMPTAPLRGLDAIRKGFEGRPVPSAPSAMPRKDRANGPPACRYWSQNASWLIPEARNRRQRSAFSTLVQDGRAKSRMLLHLDRHYRTRRHWRHDPPIAARIELRLSAAALGPASAFSRCTAPRR